MHLVNIKNTVLSLMACVAAIALSGCTASVASRPEPVPSAPQQSQAAPSVPSMPAVPDGYDELANWTNGETLPEDGLQGATPSLHYHLDDFHNALGLLRKEGTVWLLYSGSGGGFENGLRTDLQAEGERSPAQIA